MPPFFVLALKARDEVWTRALQANAATALQFACGAPSLRFCTIRMEGARCAESCRRRLADPADLLLLYAHGRFLAQAGDDGKQRVSCRPGARCRLAVRHGDGGRQPGLAGGAGHGRRRGALRTGERGIFRAWLDSGDALCGLGSDAGLLRSKIGAGCGSCAVDSGVSWAALRPEDARAECLPVCRDGRVQRGDCALRHGARHRGAARLRSGCKRAETAAGRNSAARDRAAGGAGAHLCSAGRTCGGDVQPGAAVLPGSRRAAARWCCWG